MVRDGKVRVATLIKDTKGLGPQGRPIPVSAGEYVVADLDGVDDDMLYLQDPTDPELLLAAIPDYFAHTIQRVMDTGHAISWARYYRNHPETVAAWAETDHRPTNCPCCQRFDLSREMNRKVSF